MSEGFDNTWYPSSTALCLADGSYDLSIQYLGRYSGASIDACGAYVGAFQTKFNFELIDGECECTNAEVQLTSTDGTWYDYYYYEIKYIGSTSLSRTTWRGSLPLSRIAYYRLCLPAGPFVVSLKRVGGIAYPGSNYTNNTVNISSCDLYLDLTSPSGTCQVPNRAEVGQTTDDDAWKLNGTMNNAMITLNIGLALAAAAIVVGLYYFWIYVSNKKGDMDKSYSGLPLLTISVLHPYAESWALLRNPTYVNTGDEQKLVEILSELSIEEAVHLKYISEDDIQRIAECFKKGVPRGKFLEAVKEAK